MPRQSSTRKTTAPGFEKSLAELEKLVERMESGEQNLEDALKDFERGIELTRQCQGALQEAELKVRKLLEQNGPDGSNERLVPLDDESEDA